MNMIYGAVGGLLGLLVTLANPAVASADVEPWQVAVRPVFAGCDAQGRNVYSVNYANDMYDNPEQVAVGVTVSRRNVVTRSHVVNLPPYASKNRYYRVAPGNAKRFVSRVNGEVATRFVMEGLPC